MKYFLVGIGGFIAGLVTVGALSLAKTDRANREKDPNIEDLENLTSRLEVLYGDLRADRKAEQE